MITNVEVKMCVGCDDYTITIGDAGEGGTTPDSVAIAMLGVQAILRKEKQNDN